MSVPRMSALILVAVLTAALAIPAVAQNDDAAQDDDTAQVSVIHGIPEAVVDVYINGALALEDFEPGTVTDELTLPAGDYDLAVYAADADPDSDAAVVDVEGVAVPGGINASIVANLTADGQPALNVFVNDTTATEDAAARVAVRHTAAAPAVDVFVNDTVTFEDLTNPTEATAVIPEGTYEIAVSVADAPVEDAVIGPVDLDFPGDTLSIVYAIGSAADGTLGAVVQTVDLDAAAEPTPDPTEPETSQVSVVHAIPGAVVDVYINGALALEDFEPGTVTDELTLPAGEYDLSVFPADADTTSTGAIAQAEDVSVPAGINASIVANLTAEGEPTLNVFVNDTSAVDHTEARVTVRHTAAAPAVDVFVDGAATFEDLTNPNEATAVIPEGTYEIAVSVADTPVEDAVIGPVDLDFPGDTLSIVYAIGSAADGTLGAVVQTVALGTDGPGPDPTEPTEERSTSRLAGDSRIDTAIAISNRAFPDGSGTVYLARQDQFADALAGGVLTDGPILLVPNCGQLPEQVGEEINRLEADDVIALGGTLAICDSILEQAAAS